LGREGRRMKEYIMIKETGNAPITVAELIRCKDCKYSRRIITPFMDCDRFRRVTDTEQFCSWAERKEE
jgi:hypothetical protein